jgi:predicted GNAT family acetyltransferase
MAVPLIRQDLTATFNDCSDTSGAAVINELYRKNEQEVLEFLSVRPVHTVFMVGLIRDNGLISPHNRGSFYGARNQYGELVAVALIGHATVIEAHNEEALAGFAAIARNCHNAYLIRGERKVVNTFWKHYGGREPRQISRELLFQLTHTPENVVDGNDFRPATMADLDKVMSVNSTLALEEGGINPLLRDPGGFRVRTARRIEQGRVWVWINGNRLIFKADIVSQTPQVSYLEGIYVHPEERRKGYGLRCLSNLSSALLTTSNSICLTVNHRNKPAVAFYKKAGFQFHSHYETLYIR